MSQNRSTAVMQRRVEPHDSLDDFPTPPWATRALCEHVIPEFIKAPQSVWEPSCNRGHMAKPLRDYFNQVYASDIHDYGWSGQQAAVDFLWPTSAASVLEQYGAHFIITNPPFRLAEQFIERGLEVAKVGCAVIVRTAFLEGVARHNGIFSNHPPAIVAQFAERVLMVKGRLDGKAASATAYCWLVFLKNKTNETKLVWIPPCRKQLERPEDYQAYEKTMARTKGSKNKEQVASVGHNSGLTDDEIKALHFGQHVPDYEKAVNAKKKADADLKNTCKRIKAEGGSVAKVKRTIALRTPEGEAAFRAEFAELAEITQWNGLGIQIDMFGDERTPSEDTAFDNGKRAGMSGDPARPPHDPSTAQYRKWMEGHGEGQGILASGFKKLEANKIEATEDELEDA